MSLTHRLNSALRGGGTKSLNCVVTQVRLGDHVSGHSIFVFMNFLGTDPEGAADRATKKPVV